MDYISCPRARSQYKVSVAICQTCKRLSQCPDYGNYLQPPLFTEAFPTAPKKKGIRKKVRRDSASQNPADAKNLPEQLLLDL